MFEGGSCRRILAVAAVLDVGGCVEELGRIVGCIWAWVDETSGGIIGGSETIDVTPIKKSLNGYLVKGTADQIAALYGRGIKAQPQGIICGRRADTSRHLGPTARRLADQKLGIRRQMPSQKGPSSYAQGIGV